MGERKFNREQYDTEPVKFKPLYLIVGICAVVIIISACAIYIYLDKKDKAVEKTKEETVTETAEEPVEYVMPVDACVKDVTVSTYSDAVYASCTSANVVLNFTDVNTIVDTTKTGTNFKINGIYYNKFQIKTDEYLDSAFFNKIAFTLNNGNFSMMVADATTPKKAGLYIFNKDKLVYSNGAETNTLFAFGEPIKYAKYSEVGLNLNCAEALPTDKVYEEGTIIYSGNSYEIVKGKDVLVSDVCK